jgi:hypothetical protein
MSGLQDENSENETTATDPADWMVDVLLLHPPVRRR